MTTSRTSSRDISRKLVALISGANFFGGLIIFLYFSVIDPLPVGGVAVRPLSALRSMLRITVGTRSENERLLAALQAVLA